MNACLNLVPVRLLCGIVCLVGAVLGAQRGHASEVISGVSVSSLEPDFLDRSSFHTAASGFVSSFLDVDDIPNYPGFHATGTASAAFRSYGVSAQVLTPVFFPAAFDSSRLIQAQSASTDVVTLPGSGAGFLKFRFHVSGSAANSHPDVLRSGMFFYFNVNGQRLLDMFSDVLGFYPSGDFETAFAPVTFGQEVLLSGGMEAYVASRGVQHDSGAIVSGIYYGNTVEMISVQVFDADKNLLPGLTILSESGTDYLASPVPAPDCAGVLALMLVTLGRWRRRTVRPRDQRSGALRDIHLAALAQA